MTDTEIIELYWKRTEDAITETNKKYGSYCRKISYNILNDFGDVEECVNDTYLKMWNIIPPQRPLKFTTFIGKIVRNISLNLYNKKNAKKRTGNMTGMDIMYALDNIDDIYIERAMHNNRRRKIRIILSGLTAACIVLVITGTIHYYTVRDDSIYSGDNTLSDSENYSGDIAPFVYVNSQLYIGSSGSEYYTAKPEDAVWLGKISDITDNSEEPDKNYQANWSELMGAGVYQYNNNILVYTDGKYWLYMPYR